MFRHCERRAQKSLPILARYQDDLLPAFEDVAAAIEAGDPVAFKAALQSLIQTGGELGSAAGDAGLKTCG